MPAMIDARCEKCGKWIGWCGSAANRPACPKCGHRPDQADLDAADAEMKKFEELLASRPNASVCRQQRVAAGLTLGQAAKLLGMEAKDLSDVESGRRPLGDTLRDMMAQCYGVGNGQ
jgi:hypothetical protein